MPLTLYDGSDDVLFPDKTSRKCVSVQGQFACSSNSRVDEGAIDVGTTIACVFGVHIGTVAVVTGSTKCKFIDANGKTRKVTKQHARRVVASIPTKPTKKRKLVAQERSLKTEPRSNCKKNI